MSLVPARVWGGQAVGIALTERLKLRRQMAAMFHGAGMICGTLFFLKKSKAEEVDQVNREATLKMQKCEQEV